MPTKKPKSKITKKSNVGLKASKFKPVKAGFKLSSLKRANRATLIAVVLVVVAVGGFYIYRSLADTAGPNAADEMVQYYNINETRYTLYSGLAPVQFSQCLNTVARNWAKTMATSGFRHNPNFTTQVGACAGTGAYSGGENIGAQSGGCTNSPSDGCSQNVYRGMLPPNDITNGEGDGHYNIIKTPGYNYVGVGSYRDGAGKMWIVQDYLGCTTCNPNTLQVYRPAAAQWFLMGRVSEASATAARAENINVHAGTAVTWYHEIKNNGPGTASYSWHVNSYHYNTAGTLVSTASLNPYPNGNATAPGDTLGWNNSVTIPSTAALGERYCQAIYMTNSWGAGTPAVISSNSDASDNGYDSQSCVSVH